MDEKKPGFIDGFTRADDTLLNISKSLVDIRDLISKREDRDIKIYFFLIPNDGGERTFAVGTTKIDFKQGIITNPDNTKELLKSGLNTYTNSDWLHSLSIRSNQDIKYRIQAFDTRTLYANYAARIPYITYDTLSITCTASTEISLFACTNPSAVIDEFSITIMQAMEQTSVKHEATEAQTWDATLTSLVSNLNRIRHQIVAITGAAWGSASAALLKSTYNANTIIKADSNDTPIALTLAEQRILGRITGGSITGLTAAQIRTLINVADGANIYPDTGEQAFLDADHTKLDAIAANATKYPDTGEQAFLDADHTKLNGVEDSATKYPDTGEQAFLDADHTKLNGIEAAADITDAVNVASTIHGVTAKATPVNSDEVGIVDSAAANVLKKLTWTNVKATLKTYFDTLYTKYPNTGEQAFLDADHTKLDAIAANATKYPDTGEQAFLDADHTKLNGIATAATKYPDTGEQAFLDADHSKLDNIEAGANVTDAVNVASSIHGVAAKATPVNADEIGLIDSAAANVLKKLTWTNVKATLKTYFDTLYNNYSHPSAPPCRAATNTVTGHATAGQITKLEGIATAATKYPDTGEQAFLDADHTKLNGIATAATKYPDTGEQAFLDADHTKLNGIETSATADLTGAEIVALLEALAAASRLSHTKLDDIGASDHHAKYTNAEALTQAKANIEDAPVNGHTEQGISSNWAYDHAAAADPHTGYVLETLFDAYSLLYADTDNTPARLTVAASRFVGRKAAGGIAAMTAAEAKAILAIGIADISNIPGTIASILTDHDKTTHDALGIAPASHGADKHTNRTRKIFISVGNGAGSGSLINTYFTPTVALDASIDENWSFSFSVPIDYSSGGTIKFVYQEPPTGGGTIIWDAVLYHFANGESSLSNQSTDTGNSLSVGGARTINEVATTLSFASLTTGEYVVVRIERDANNGSDTMASDWQLVGILFEYTADQ